MNWSEDCDTRGSVLIEFIRCDPGVRIFDSQLVLSLSLSLRNRGLKIRCDYSALGLQNNTHPPLRTPSLDKKTHPGGVIVYSNGLIVIMALSHFAQALKSS